MKKLDVYDMPKNYYIDEVTCFEHPIAVAINYYDRKSCALYLILSKMYGIYFGDSRENVREAIFESMKEILGIHKVAYGKVTSDIVKKNIDKGNPVIVGVNLKSIFYSEYYLKRDWGHWLLINGYDEQNKTFSVVDNTQFGKLGEKYDEFTITYDILLQAAKEYKKKFGNDYICITFDKESGFQYKKALLYVLEKYVNIDLEQVSEYRQIHLLEMLNDVSEKEGECNQYYCEEIKKKIINVNKYRGVLFDEIVGIMADCNYDIEKMYLYRNKIKKLYEVWDKFILLNLVKASRGRFNTDNNEINNIKNIETEIQNQVKEFINYLDRGTEFADKCKSKTIRKDEITYEKINNKDNIIYGTDKEIIFEFDNKRIYNWWIEDDAPKVKIYTGYIENNNENIRLDTNIEIVRDVFEEDDAMLQTGIYIRTYADGKNYICGVQGKEKWVLDRVGYDGQHQYINDKYKISVEINGSEIIFRNIDKNNEQKIFNQKINTDAGFEMGLMCKVWNKPQDVKIYFKNTEIR